MTVSPAHIEFKLRQTFPDFLIPVTKSQELSATPVWLQSQETRDPYFQGAFSLTPALSKAQASYLQAFLAVQHGFWPIEYVQQQSDSLREAVGLPLGEDAAFYVGHFSNGLKGRHPFIDKHTTTCPGPGDQPHCGNCPWELSTDNSQLVPDKKKLATMPLKWLGWLVSHLLTPWKINVTGVASYDDPCTSQEGRIVAESSNNIWAEVKQSGEQHRFFIIGDDTQSMDVDTPEPSVSDCTSSSSAKPLDKILLQSDYTYWSQQHSIQEDASKLELRDGVAFSGLPPDPKSRWLGLRIDGKVVFYNGQTAPTKGLKRNQEYFRALPDHVSKFYLGTVQWAKDKPEIYKQALAAYNAELVTRSCSGAN